ncbi:MAG TPA: Fic family protein [Rhizomicrobium sp.]|jgi:Fic family protein|nr:Fic family protein [Rhizomicrobium sp.]
MIWNWQRPEWPRFTWNPDLLRRAEEQFLLGGGRFAGTFARLGTDDKDQLIIEALSAEALTTSEIEGEVLDRASVQSSIRQQLGLAADRHRVKPAEQGVSEMTVHLYRSFGEPLTDDMLFEWHRMLMNGRRDIRNVGGYRTHGEPMQIVSGAVYEPKVHFEAPPSPDVPREMKRFVAWFERTAPERASPLPALTRAGIAHIYFESIHPFEDGNGRIGRAIAEKALAQGLGHPPLTALAMTILARRKAYYEALERNSTEIELTEWLRWFAGVSIEAQRRTTALIEFLLDKTKLLDRLKSQLNERQEKALLRVLHEGPEGFKGGLSAGNYVTITGASAPTATRDLADMVDKGALIRSGERRYARYRANVALRPVRAVTIDERGRLIEG